MPTTKAEDIITEGISGEKFVAVELSPIEQGDGKPSFRCGARLFVKAKLDPLEKKSE